jgi:cysteine desulfuration protein SufE
MSIEAIRSDFALLDDWEDRYRYVIELGRTLEPLPDVLRTDANKVRGCASQVWLSAGAGQETPDAPSRLHFLGDSDAHIVRGLIAILFAMYQDRTPEEILATDARAMFAELGLKEHITPQRSNGFFSMVERIRNDARAVATAA